MMAGMLLAAVASSAFLQVEELNEDLKKILAPLGSDKPEERDAAKAELWRLVSRNRKVMRRILREHLKKQKNPAVRMALLDGVGKTYSMDDLSFEVVFPRESLTVREAGSSNTRFRMRLRNNDDEEVAVIRDFKLTVLEPEGVPLKPTTYIGAGYRPEGCFLPQVPFLRIPGGHVMEWEECLPGYDGEFRLFQGFEPNRTGVHTLRFTVAFDREAFKSQCRDGCAGHDAVDKVWNGALEGKRTFDVKLPLRDETAEEQAAVRKHEQWMGDLMERYRAKKITLTELYKEIDRAKLDHRDRRRVLAVTRD